VVKKKEKEKKIWEVLKIKRKLKQRLKLRPKLKKKLGNKLQLRKLKRKGDMKKRK
jgi:hypothetical protein